MQSAPKSTLFLLAFIMLSTGVAACRSTSEGQGTPTAPSKQVSEQLTSPTEVTTNKSFTGPKANAVRSAKQYLSFSGFSRDGLIQQLSSDAGDGYQVEDATFAVDSLNNDWNNEAVRSAKQYLSISGFSCDGLIEQLSSSAGDKYTLSQATYGAQQAGACS